MNDEIGLQEFADSLADVRQEIQEATAGRGQEWAALRAACGNHWYIANSIHTGEAQARWPNLADDDEDDEPEMLDSAQAADIARAVRQLAEAWRLRRLFPKPAFTLLSGYGSGPYVLDRMLASGGRALLTGSAQTGKTTLVKHFAETHHGVRVLAGAEVNTPTRLLKASADFGEASLTIIDHAEGLLARKMEEPLRYVVEEQECALVLVGGERMFPVLQSLRRVGQFNWFAVGLAHGVVGPLGAEDLDAVFPKAPAGAVRAVGRLCGGSIGAAVSIMQEAAIMADKQGKKLSATLVNEVGRTLFGLEPPAQDALPEAAPATTLTAAAM